MKKNESKQKVIKVFFAIFFIFGLSAKFWHFRNFQNSRNKMVKRFYRMSVNKNLFVGKTAPLNVNLILIQFYQTKKMKKNKKI